MSARPAASPSGAARELVSIAVADQLFGIPVLQVRDVLALPAIARVPLAPPDVAGSLNLRGRIVTAIDLRTRFGLPPAPPALRRMGVVVEWGGELYCFLVDRVGEVLRLDATALEANPPMLDALWRGFSEGVYRRETGLLVLLDVARTLGLGGAVAA